MPRTVTLTGVANSEVPRIKGEYEHEGATVTVTPDGPDTSTIVAVWPAASAGDAAQVHAAAAEAHAAAATAHAAAATALLAAVDLAATQI